MKGKQTIRTGIVGAGFSARFHWEALRRVHSVNVDVRGVYALDGAQARKGSVGVRPESGGRPFFGGLCLKSGWKGDTIP